MTTFEDAPADRGAEIILAAFRAYEGRFDEITRRARRHFERRDWHGAQADSALRLDLYSEVVREALESLLPLLGEAIHERPTWTSLRAAYAARISRRSEDDLAETFFNSMTRRIFHTVGVDPAVEFVKTARSTRGPGSSSGVTVTFSRGGSTEDLLRMVLAYFRFAAPFEDLDRDVALAAAALERGVGGRPVRAVEMARTTFFRSKGAYLVGKVRTEGGDLPLTIALVNPDGGVVVDAILLDEDEVSIVFSFARSYFLVETERPADLVGFLQTIMPRKPVYDLYNAIGRNKHGKTELYRALLRHLETTEDRFAVAPGQRGMVMCVFTLPGFDVVFKVIRDRFEPPKTVTHQEVRDKYRLVFRHDRAGRLVDAQEFEHLEFDRDRFDDDLLRELTTSAAETVRIDGNSVVIRHLYTERRLKPLDVHLRESTPEEAQRAVVDYGRVLKDLAATNIFPGDMLLKNFGVSRHGRLIFYDYDELCVLTDCVFRELPPPRDDAEEVSSEPWFYVGDKDIFPEEFRSFLGLKGDLLRTFLAVHDDLLRPEFWRRMQERLRVGEVLDIFPYDARRRLRPQAVLP